MPAGAYSSARLRVSPMMPALAAAYGNMPGIVSVAWIDAMLTIDPRRARFIGRSAYFAHSHAPLRSTANVRSQSASVISVASKYALIPALLTSTSSVPWRASRRSTAPRTSVSAVMSTWQKSACRPAADSSASVCRPARSSTSPNVTSAPSATNFSTIARPMRRAPPVTNAIFSLSRAMPDGGVILYGSMVRCALACIALVGAAACGGSNAADKPAPPPPAKKASATSAPFGDMPNGPALTVYTLTNANGVEVRTIPYGAIIVSVRVPDKNGKFDDVLLGFDRIDGYAGSHPYFGAIVGRYGNRIAKASFTLDGQQYALAANNGPNSLHGGVKGFDKKVWGAELFDRDGNVGVIYTVTSPDGDEGYPGNLKAQVTYTLTKSNELTVEYEASTDKATPINLTQHKIGRASCRERE